MDVISHRQSGCVVFSDVVFKRYVCSDWWWMFPVIELDVFSDVCSSGTYMQ